LNFPLLIAGDDDDGLGVDAVAASTARQNHRHSVDLEPAACWQRHAGWSARPPAGDGRDFRRPRRRHGRRLVGAERGLRARRNFFSKIRQRPSA
jgi:hypothetical protein